MFKNSKRNKNLERKKFKEKFRVENFFVFSFKYENHTKVFGARFYEFLWF